MDWNDTVQSQATATSSQHAYPNNDPRYTGHPIGLNPSENSAPYALHPQMNMLPAKSTMFHSAQRSRLSYFESSLPLYCADWLSHNNADYIALSTFKESLTNKLHVLAGFPYDCDSTVLEEWLATTSSPQKARPNQGFELQPVAELNVDYPVTKLQWDPQLANSSGPARLATSLDVLRLYMLENLPHDALNSPLRMIQTHALVNTSSTGSPSLSSFELPSLVNVFPPVTSFDWNKVNTNTIITSSVDTTCTVWDLNRSRPSTGQDELLNAVIKTQLIAHDSEVFDVKFLNKSLETFASVGNDGLMRIFDLRALEHSTIIYEPPQLPTTPVRGEGMSTAVKSNALIKLDVCNANQNYLATIGVNSNQVLVIDIRMPGIPIATLDGSLGGRNPAPINLILWHPTSNHILTGGDDCAAQVWDCSRLLLMQNSPVETLNSQLSQQTPRTIGLPILAHEEELEVNAACWRRGSGDWMGIVSGKGFQAVHL